MKVAFISSLERSGSTILDLQLSNIPNYISFGEVWRVIMPHGGGLDTVQTRNCTCGEDGMKCQIWENVFNRIRSEGDGALSLTDRYEIFLDVVREKYGENVIVVDSSKSIQALDALNQAKNAEVFVLSTLRDVRGWMHSIRKAEQRKREMQWGKIFEPDFKYFWLSYIRHNLLRMLPLWLANEWLLRNARIMLHVKRLNLPCLRLSYEGLVFSNASTMKNIKLFLSGDDVISSERVFDNQVHIIRGNRTAFVTQSDEPLTYDTSWMSLWKYSLQLAVMPWVSVLNRKWVYHYLFAK